MLFTHNVKQIKGAAHKNSDVVGTCKEALTLSHLAVGNIRALNFLNYTFSEEKTFRQHNPAPVVDPGFSGRSLPTLIIKGGKPILDFSF